MSSVTDSIINWILKRGVVTDGRNIDVTFEIPFADPERKPIKIIFKAEHAELRIEQNEKV